TGFGPLLAEGRVPSPARRSEAPLLVLEIAAELRSAWAGRSPVPTRVVLVPTFEPASVCVEAGLCPAWPGRRPGPTWPVSSAAPLISGTNKSVSYFEITPCSAAVT